MCAETFPIAIAQHNVTVGDIAGNLAKLLKAHAEAAAKGAELVVYPELALIGYPPEDLVLSPAFRKSAMQALETLAVATKNGPAIIVGGVFEQQGQTHNAAVLLDEGRIQQVQPKTKLPNYGIFDEKRIFTAGNGVATVQCRGKMLGLLVCEDAWTTDLALTCKKQGAEVLIVINASPFEAGKLELRKKVIGEIAGQTALPVVYANLVGGQDDIVFDGGSFVMSPQQKVLAQLPEFESALQIVSITDAASAHVLSTEETLWQAMMLGLRDYVEKNGFPGVIVGLSGGIDSALTATVAADALGASRVRGVLLPSPYTSKDSVDDATALAKALGIETMTVPINAQMQVSEEVLNPVFKTAGWMEDVAVGGNLQARLRGLTLMAISNKTGFMLLSTGNKSEIAVGYTTLYGDSCGGYNVLKDLYKTQIYVLAEWRNAHQPHHAKGPKGAVIPKRSITRAPTAELAPGQRDEDQLPPYALLDKILYHHIEERRSAAELIALGFTAKTVNDVVAMVRKSEYKRRQSCPGVKLSPMLFGKDRRYPLTNGYIEKQ